MDFGAVKVTVGHLALGFMVSSVVMCLVHRRTVYTLYVKCTYECVYIYIYRYCTVYISQAYSGSYALPPC